MYRICLHVAVALWNDGVQGSQPIGSELWMCIPNDQLLIPIVYPGNYFSFDLFSKIKLFLSFLLKIEKRHFQSHSRYNSLNKKVLKLELNLNVEQFEKE